METRAAPSLENVATNELLFRAVLEAGTKGMKVERAGLTKSKSYFSKDGDHDEDDGDNDDESQHFPLKLFFKWLIQS